MEILLYNTAKGHDELFGFLLDYFNRLDIVPDVLTKKNHHDWMAIYQDRYRYNLIEKADSQYHYAISMNDPKIKDIVDGYALEYIYTKHSSIFPNAKSKIQSYIYLAPTEPGYVVPCFDYISYEDKRKALLVSQEPLIVIIGKLKDALGWLKKIKNLKDFKVIHFCRKNSTKEGEYGDLNIEVMIDTPTTEMFEICTNARYVLSISNHLRKDVQSGSINAAFTLGCQLILKDIDKDKYKLNSPLYVKDKEGLVIPAEPDLNAVYVERDKLIVHGRRYLDKLISNKIPKIVHCKVPDAEPANWSKKFARSIENLQTVLRSDLYEYRYWTDSAIEELIRSDYPELYTGYKSIGEENIIRLLALHKYGGITVAPDFKIPPAEVYNSLKHDAINISQSGLIASMSANESLYQHIQSINGSEDKKVSTDRLRAYVKDCYVVDAKSDRKNTFTIRRH